MAAARQMGDQLLEFRYEAVQVACPGALTFDAAVNENEQSPKMIGEKMCIRLENEPLTM